MAKAFPLTIFTILGLVFVCLASAKSKESPFILAHKRVSLTKVNPGLERVSVFIDIYNSGSDTAFDVNLTDDTWAQEIFDSVIGNTSASWEKLDAGSLVSHSFELESQVKTVYYGAPALITYRIPTSVKLQEAYSTPILPLKILSDPPAQKTFELAKTWLVKYGSHISVFLLVGLFAHMLTTPGKTSAATGNKKKH